MRKALAFVFAFACVLQAGAQQQSEQTPPTGTMRPVIRGTHAAISSMKPEATRAAENILRAGGNAFDAAVAGQAVLALVDPAMNGIGSDAEILVYDAKTKQPYSINAEGTAPKLATIDWYNKNQGGKIPNSDGLLSATVPGAVDAWFILLDRWGTMSFEKVLEQAIEAVGSTDREAVTKYIKTHTFDTIAGKIDLTKQSNPWFWTVGQWHNGVFDGVKGVKTSGEAPVQLKTGW